MESIQRVLRRLVKPSTWCITRVYRTTTVKGGVARGGNSAFSDSIPWISDLRIQPVRPHCVPHRDCIEMPECLSCGMATLCNPKNHNRRTARPHIRHCRSSRHHSQSKSAAKQHMVILLRPVVISGTRPSAPQSLMRRAYKQSCIHDTHGKIGRRQSPAGADEVRIPVYSNDSASMRVAAGLHDLHKLIARTGTKNLTN